MRKQAKFIRSTVQAPGQLFYLLILGLLLSGIAKASTDSLGAPLDAEEMFKSVGKLTLDCRAYIKSHKPSYTHRARKVVIECIDLSDDSKRYYLSKSGKLALEFNLDTRYLVYISKEGYETKMLAFSTKGANLVTNYKFDFDLLLEKSGKATYSEHTPAIYVVYNRMHKLFLYRRFLNRSASNR